MATRHHKPLHRPSADGAKGARSPAQPVGQKSYAKIHPKDLPIIDLLSGPNISHIRDAIQHHCQRELGDISAIFIDGHYKKPATATFDADAIAADSTGILKQQASARAKRADVDNDLYEKSKPKLHGLLSSMTTRELDEKITAHREQTIQISATSLAATVAAAISSIQNTTKKAGSDEDHNKSLEADITNILCPLSLWKNIVHVTTTRSNGNRRNDQNTLAINFANLKQRSGETIADFKRRIMTMLDSYEALEMIRPSDTDIATRFLYGLDDFRYASLKTYIGNEMANGRDLYPTDLENAATQATRWIVHGTKSNDLTSSNIMTFYSKSKPKTTNPTQSIRANEATACTFCTRPGHTIEKCYKFEAAKKAALTNLKPPHAKKGGQSKPPNGPPVKPTVFFSHHHDEDTDEEPPASTHLCYSARAIDERADLLPHQIVLDTGANASIIKNRDLLSNIRRVAPIAFGGIGGTITATESGQLYDIGTAYLSDKCPANILSFSHTREHGNKIRFIQHPDGDAFVVTTATQSYRFERQSNGLFVHDFAAENSGPILIATVDANEKLYLKKEVSKAKEARHLQQRLANPPDGRFTTALTHGCIIAPTILPADIQRANAIYGANPRALQGRTTTQTAKSFPLPLIPRVQDPQHMYADLFFAVQMPFLITITKPLEHILASPLDGKDASSLRKVLRKHLGFYGQRRITITTLYCDNERGISALESDLAAAGITLINSGPGMHVHTAERAIRYVKEGARGVLSGLPYQCPRSIFKMLPSFIALRLNLFPVSTRNDFLSAFQLLYNRPAIADKDCHLEFGALYHITTRDGSNTMAPRTMAGIGIGQVPNGTGTCNFYMLHNHQLVTANHFVLLPMTQDVITYLNAIASKDRNKVTADIPYLKQGIPIDESDPLPPTLFPPSSSPAPVTPTAVDAPMQLDEEDNGQEEDQCNDNAPGDNTHTITEEVMENAATETLTDTEPNDDLLATSEAIDNSLATSEEPLTELPPPEPT